MDVVQELVWNQVDRFVDDTLNAKLCINYIFSAPFTGTTTRPSESPSRSQNTSIQDQEEDFSKDSTNASLDDQEPAGPSDLSSQTAPVSQTQSTTIPPTTAATTSECEETSNSYAPRRCTTVL